MPAPRYAVPSTSAAASGVMFDACTDSVHGTALRGCLGQICAFGQMAWLIPLHRGGVQAPNLPPTYHQNSHTSGSSSAITSPVW